ncbi:Transcription factor GAMYB like [Actinidia chinensis var. chinensis]|uniref:Transcription factor GAMYB like n=1 Tax=Actinidia chinensis var. chinensis TaxID=1590841 RepID=A0A2R6QJY1_ACTCC|nr:Transcription factor GAMYB like [Actinidia chinensis var. chinensis]
MARRQRSEEMIKKGPWTAEEDEVLVNFVNKYGPRDWSSIRSMGLLPRTGKSCRLRWINKLRPNLKIGCKFSAEEERVVIDLQARFGNKWATIASYLQGRTDNDVKNFWSSRQKRLARILQSSSQCKPHKNKGKAHEIPTWQAKEFINSPQMKEESSSKYQSCPSACIGAPEMMQMTIMPLPDNLIAPNFANIDSILPSLDTIEPDNFGRPSAEVNPLQLPNPKLELPLLPESHDPVLQGLVEPNFLENVSQLNFGSPFVDNEKLTTPESFFDELPADMFDFL